MSIFNTKHEYLALKTAWAVSAQASYTTGAHMVLYNLIRGYSVDRGFTPVTNPMKLSNGCAVNAGLVEACLTLNRMIQTKADDHKFKLENLARFLAPFNGTLTLEILQKIPLVQVSLLTPDFGSGLMIANTIIKNKLTKISFSDIEEMLETAQLRPMVSVG